jgi:hypothetical protein
MSTGQLDSTERVIRQRLKDDFAHYSTRCLRIKTKKGETDLEGRLLRFTMNEPQRYIHKRIEDQLRLKGRVRVIILKGRQQGCSTYTEGRFYWKVSHRRGVNAYILTHQDDATSNLFSMVKTYHDNCPDLIKPQTGAANAKELSFVKLESGYKVSTAGSKGAGRSATIQYFHGSEVAYWPNAESHVAGALQAVPDADGTEVVLESTSAGPSGLFYELSIAAQKGEGEFELIFVPWWWSTEYRKTLPPRFQLTDEEIEYKTEHGLCDEQMYWRRQKIVELRGIHHFRREYPATVEEAFKASATGALWTQELIDAYRLDKLPEVTDRKGIKQPITLRRIVVAVDPSGGDGPQNDEVGIAVGGIDDAGHIYILADKSGKFSPDEWGGRAVTSYHAYQADRIVAEQNFGGDMVKTIVLSKDKRVSYKHVTASRGKQQRAEPVKALYERGLVHHVGRFSKMEDEMTTWDPEKSNNSPNRLDAVVWLVTELGLNGPAEVEIDSF